MNIKRLALLLICSMIFSLSASYPDLTLFDEKGQDISISDSLPLSSFLETWGNFENGTTLSELASSLPAMLTASDTDLALLQRVVNLQSAQLDFSIANARSRVGLQATPYSYSDTTVPAGGISTRTKKHSFSVSTSVSQALPTAGSLSLNIGQSSSYSITSTKEAWTHTPQLSVQLQQPLWVGQRMIDTSYQKQQLEKQSLSVSTANLSYEALKEVLVIQNMRLLNLMQTLKETRFILQGRARLAFSALEKAQSDYEAGLISMQSLERAKLSYYQILASRMSVERELEDLEATLAKTWKEAIPQQIVLSGFDPFALSTFFEDPNLAGKYLLSDLAYQQSLKELRKASIDSNFSDLSDAVQLSLSLQLSPYYDPSANNTFFSSFDELVSSSNPIVSFSIGISASDLFRRTSSFKQETTQIGLEQASLNVAKAQQEALDALRTMHMQLTGYLLDVLVQLEQYTLVQMEWEAQQVRFEAKLIDQDALFAKQLDWYQAAFTVLATLRDIELLQLRMQYRQLL